MFKADTNGRQFLACSRLKAIDMRLSDLSCLSVRLSSRLHVADSEKIIRMQTPIKFLFKYQSLSLSCFFF
jgi:hypothetical protein